MTGVLQRSARTPMLADGDFGRVCGGCAAAREAIHSLADIGNRTLTSRHHQNTARARQSTLWLSRATNLSSVRSLSREVLLVSRSSPVGI
jgi:hypothetical protein